MIVNRIVKVESPVERREVLLCSHPSCIVIEVHRSLDRELDHLLLTEAPSEKFRISLYARVCLLEGIESGTLTYHIKILHSLGIVTSLDAALSIIEIDLRKTECRVDILDLLVVWTYVKRIVCLLETTPGITEIVVGRSLVPTLAKSS